MKSELITYPAFTLVGLRVRTNNQVEMDPKQSKIARLMEYYWNHRLADHIKHRLAAGITYAVYTSYASDEYGEYSYFIGERVAFCQDQNPEFTSIEIPAAKYQKFTTDRGKIPETMISAWQEIWAMSPEALGGKRCYQADFEIYDAKARDPNNAVVDIYIGID